jgi:hypothetical protein
MAKVQPEGEHPLNFGRLKEKQRAIRDDFPEPLTLRVHRAISWLGRAEREHDDADVRFILLWVGLQLGLRLGCKCCHQQRTWSFQGIF